MTNDVESMTELEALAARVRELFGDEAYETAICRAFARLQLAAAERHGGVGRLSAALLIAGRPKDAPVVPHPIFHRAVAAELRAMLREH